MLTLVLGAFGTFAALGAAAFLLGLTRTSVGANSSGLSAFVLAELLGVASAGDTLGFGQKIKRKKPGSFEKADWSKTTAQPRLKVFPVSYLDNEKTVEEEATSSLLKMDKIVIT